MRALLATLLATVPACFTAPANPGMAAWNTTASRPAQDSPYCTTAIQQMDTCKPRDEHAQIVQPKPEDERAKAQFENVLSMSRQGMKQMCPQTDLAPHFANQDRCIAEAREAYKREQEEQRTRLPAERPRVASVKADPHYAVTLDRLHRATADQKRASEDLDYAKDREGLDCGRRQSDCVRMSQLRGRVADAERDRSSAEHDLLELTSAHHIDDRDGEELGLW